MIDWPKAPRAHRDPDEIEKKLALIDADHVQPLNNWVRRLNANRSEEGADVESVIPWFDPSCGGINARVLFLLEAPGRRAVATRGSGFVSMDNHDGTAANFFTLADESGLLRSEIALWNIVPWYLPAGNATKATRRGDVLEAMQHTEGLLAIFPHLELVITMGVRAREGWELLVTRSERIAGLDSRAVPHPSATNLNTNPASRSAILSTMREAALLIRKRSSG